MKLSELTKPELDRIRENANFTEEEAIVFDLASAGKTVVEIAYKMNVCERTVNRKLLKVRKKIIRVEGILNG